MSGQRKSLMVNMAWFSLLSLLAPVSIANVPMQLEIGMQKRHTVNQPIDRVAVGNPAVADVSVINAREILITPLAAGTTNLTIWPDKGKNVEQLTLQVVAAGQSADDSLQRLEADSFSAQAVGDEIQLKGKIPSLEQHSAVRQALNINEESGIDSSEITHPSQVQIDIKIVEISKSRLQSAGFFLGKGLNGNTPRVLGTPGSITGANVEGGLISLTGNGVPQTGAFNLIYGRQSNGLLAALSVLEGNGFAYTLAEPSLMAMSGQSANFLAGGEFPEPVRGGGFDNSVTIEYKEFGVRVALTPTVLDSNRIALKVAPEVSELDFNAGIESGGVTVPALRVRRTDTTVALGDGESFVISGLISQNTIANVDKLPGLGDIPILGAFFRSNQLDRQDRELLMIVTPRLVQPIARTAQLPELPGERYRNYDPSFAEFLFNENGRFGEKAPVNSGFSK